MSLTPPDVTDPPRERARQQDTHSASRALPGEASTLADDGMHECLEQTMYALDISPPTHGGVVKVHYPFEFRSNDDGDGSGGGSNNPPR